MRAETEEFVTTHRSDVFDIFPAWSVHFLYVIQYFWGCPGSRVLRVLLNSKAKESGAAACSVRKRKHPTGDPQPVPCYGGCSGLCFVVKPSVISWYCRVDWRSE